MKPGLNDARSTARALSARNAVAFECVHSLDACLEKLAALSLRGAVDRERVDLSRGYARFQGRWSQDAAGTHLSGHVERSRRAMVVLILFLGPIAALVAIGLRAAMTSGWEGPALFFFILPAVIATVGVPLVAMGLGSARVASEIELVRAIGQAIGDPAKYAVHWRRLRDD